MDSKDKYHLNKNQNPLFKELTINRLKKNNKILISKYQNNDNNSEKAKSSIDKLQKAQKDNNLTNYKISILKHIRISDNSQKAMGKSLNKNAIYDLSDLINNLNPVKSHSINIKQKNSIIANINKNNNEGPYSRGKMSRKTIEKEKEHNNNDFQLSNKTFNLNYMNNINKNEFTLSERVNLRGNKINKKNNHDIIRNIDNLDIDNLINKFKQYKIINKSTDKNNININLNINNIQNIQNIQNIETIDINKINPNQRLLLVKNEIFNSYVNCGKVYKDKNLQDQHFKTLQNYSIEKKNNNHVFSTNSNTFRNSNNSSNIKNKLNSIRDNLFNKNNAKKNIKLNYNILINKANANANNKNQELLPKFSSFETINNNKRNSSLKTKYNSNNNNYIYDFSNEINDNKTINNETIKNGKNKRIYFRVLSSKKKKFISFGEILKKENPLINNNSNNNKNIILKLSKIKNKNPGLLPKSINAINHYNSNNLKPKNYFNHKITKANFQKEIHNNYYTINTKNNNNTLNLINSPQEQGLKLLLKNKKIDLDKNTFIKNNKHLNNNDIEYINTNPENVKEYTDEILINLLIEEKLFNEKKKMILNTDILNNYGINPVIRSCLIDSLIGLQDTFKCCDKTIFITIKIFDNYISSIISGNNPNSKIEDSDLDIIIVSCFLIASKMEESFIYHLTDYLSILSDKYNTAYLTNIEYNILKYYNFEAFEPNSLDFFEIFSSLYELDEKTKKKGISFLIAILLNVDLSQIPSSVIAFSVLYLVCKKEFDIIANKIDNLFYNLNKWSDWNSKNYKDKEKNEILFKYKKLIEPLKKEKNLKEISDMILYFKENIPKTEFINIIKKIENYN